MLIDITLPYYEQVSVALWVMMSAEALAYHRDDLQARWGDYYALTRTNVTRGALASGADYVQASRVRRVAQQQLGKIFDTVDVIAGPTAAVAAPTTEGMSQPRLMDRFFRTVHTGYWDATGNPALALPMGFNAAGLPLSLQLAGRPFEEALVLRAGDAYQTVTDWHLRVPALVSQTAAAA